MNRRIKDDRFHWDRALEKIIDYETCESYYDDECVDILNQLNYDNYLLEDKIKTKILENGRLSIKIEEVVKENNQLKQDYQDYQDQVRSFFIENMYKIDIHLRDEITNQFGVEFDETRNDK